MSNVPEKVHAELGASVAARWMACPGSVRLSRGTANVESEYARAGTAAHAVAEMALTRSVEPDMWLGLSVEGVEVDEDMVEAVSVFVDYCRSLLAPSASPKHYWIEQRFSLAELNPPGPMFGTADFVAYNPAVRELEVVDYKNGSGIVVEVKGNKQLRYYALGAALTMKGLAIDTVKITVVQPNAGHPDGVVRSEVIDYFDLLAFANELLDSARATLDPNAPLVAGPHCRFCPASPVCPAQREMVQALAQVAFEAMPLDVPPAPEALPPEIFSDILSKLPILDSWADAMRAEAMRRLEAGEGVTGFKLVPKRATRSWSNPSQVEKWLWDEKGLRAEEIFTQKLKSPAQIEKVIGKKNLPEEFVEKKSSGNTLAPTSDPRPAVALAAQDVFQALPSGETE